MSFTMAGLDHLWQGVLPSLNSASLCVGNGGDPMGHDDDDLSGPLTAERPVEEVEYLGHIEEDGRIAHRVILRATFGEEAANFDWREIGVKLSDGTLIDRTIDDGGRKAQGSVWTLESVLDLMP